jgi:hypothetical protein
MSVIRTAIAVALALAAGVPASPAQEAEKAQPSPEPSDGLAGIVRLGTMGPQTPISILMAPAVQAELKLSESQKTKAYDLALAAGQKYREVFQGLLFDGETDPRELFAARNSLRQENDLGVRTILDAKQTARLNQIVLQAEGPLAVSRPEVASKLRLSPTQNDQVQGVMIQLQQRQRLLYAAARREARTFAQLDPERFRRVREQMAKTRDAAVARIGKVIDRRQKAAFNKMLGEPFDMAKLDPDTKPAATGAAKDESAKSKEETPAENAQPQRPAHPGRRKPRARPSASG